MGTIIAIVPPMNNADCPEVSSLTVDRSGLDRWVTTGNASQGNDSDDNAE
jgi:hypothetical protein